MAAYGDWLFAAFGLHRICAVNMEVYVIKTYFVFRYVFQKAFQKFRTCCGTTADVKRFADGGNSV